MSVTHKPTKAVRCRGWSVVSQNLTAEHLRAAVEALPPSARAVAMIHDRDRASHGHLFLYDAATPRTADAVRRMFPVPVIVRPYVTLPEDYEPDPGKQTGKYAMARAARYLTHEHPTEQAKGKALYADEEMICRAGYDWRADVDQLNERERVRPLTEERLPLAERVRRQVLRGQLTARQVFEQYPAIWPQQRPAVWEDLEERGRRWAAQDAHEAQQAARRQAAAERAAQQAEQAAQQAQRQAQEAERRQAEQQAAQARREAEQAARRRWDEEDRGAEYEHERTRLRMVAMLAWDADASEGDMDIAAARHAVSLAERYAQDEDLDPLILHGEYAEGGALSYADALTVYEDTERELDELGEEIAELHEIAGSHRAGAARHAAKEAAPVGPAAAQQRLTADLAAVQAGEPVQGSAEYVRLVETAARETREQERAAAVTGWLAGRLRRVDEAEAEAVRAWAAAG